MAGLGAHAAQLVAVLLTAIRLREERRISEDVLRRLEHEMDLSGAGLHRARR